MAILQYVLPGLIPNGRQPASQAASFGGSTFILAAGIEPWPRLGGKGRRALLARLVSSGKPSSATCHGARRRATSAVFPSFWRYSQSPTTTAPARSLARHRLPPAAKGRTFYKLQQWPAWGSLGSRVGAYAPSSLAAGRARWRRLRTLRSARLAFTGSGGRACAPTPRCAAPSSPHPFGAAREVSRLRRDLCFPLARLRRLWALQSTYKIAETT